MKITTTITTTAIILMLFTVLTTTISKKTSMDREKSSPFECGFSPISKARMPFSIHFFTIAMIFLVFDVETALIMPITISSKLSTLKEWAYSSMMILTPVMYGLYHEWKNNMLEWAK
nr:NADH dehydrogenase subunit 3 [Borysthenes sp. 1 WQW-2023a]